MRTRKKILLYIGRRTRLQGYMQHNKYGGGGTAVYGKAGQVYVSSLSPGTNLL